MKYNEAVKAASDRYEREVRRARKRQQAEIDGSTLVVTYVSRNIYFDAVGKMKADFGTDIRGAEAWEWAPSTLKREYWKVLHYK